MNNHAKEMANLLSALIRFPTVQGKAEEGAPFGKENAECLKYALEHAESLGFSTENFDGYAGHVEWGEGEKVFGILNHLDVVPAGDGWKTPPFSGIIANGVVKGRGAIDNKGPVTSALYALKELRDEGFVPKYKIRLILGCNEESGWKCMAHYGEVCKMPDFGISPDGSFPVIHCEKGVANFRFRIRSDASFPILDLRGGERVNMVPSKCMLSYDVADERIDETFDGVSAHGSTPEEGDNAIWKALAYLNRIFTALDEKNVFTLLYEKLCSTDGAPCGLNLSDEKSGSLSFNLGKISMVNGFVIGELDIRYPITLTRDLLLEKLQATIPGATWELFGFHDPLYVDNESPFVTALMDAYRKVTGRNEPTKIIGGGTYARVLPLGVAFGPVFDEDESTVHKANEEIAIDRLVLLKDVLKEAIRNVNEIDI